MTDLDYLGKRGNEELVSRSLSIEAEGRPLGDDINTKSLADRTTDLLERAVTEQNQKHKRYATANLSETDHLILRNKMIQLHFYKTVEKADRRDFQEIGGASPRDCVVDQIYSTRNMKR